MEEISNKTTTLGLKENTEGALCYSLGLITGILLLLIEKQSQFVRFHAIQSTSVFLPLFLIQILTFVSLTFASLILSPIIVLLEAILWIFLMYKAYRGERYKLPIFGDFSERLLSNLSV
jgi:uncharacterized membrane protein